MTNPLGGEPLLRMSYRQAWQVPFLASNGAMHARYVQGVLLGEDDAQILRALAERNIIVRLECTGHPTYQGRVQQLLKRLVHVPTTTFWYLPTTKTGPLRQAR